MVHRILRLITRACNCGGGKQVRTVSERSQPKGQAPLQRDSFLKSRCGGAWVLDVTRRDYTVLLS